MKNEQFRDHVNRALSDLTWTEDMEKNVLRAMEEREGKPMKKLSLGLALALALMIATTAAALATGGFGILQYVQMHAPEKAENRAYLDTVLTVGQTYEGEAFTLSVNEAAFDGMRLTAAMEIRTNPDAKPVFVLPSARAFIGEKAADVFWLGGSYDDEGFWAPDIDRMATYAECGGVEIVLRGGEEDAGEYLPVDQTVQWELVYTVYQPTMPLIFTDEDEPAIGEEAWTEEQYAAHEQAFYDAYKDGKILLDQYADPWWYLSCLPQLDGVDGGEKTAVDVWRNAVALGVFRQIDQAVFRFETKPVSVRTVENRPLFTLPDGLNVALEKMDVSVDRVNFVLRVCREDGTPVTEDYNSWPWGFALLAENAETKSYGGSAGMEPDGSLVIRWEAGLSRPAERLFIVPCREENGIQAGMQNTGEVYRRQAPVTDEQKAWMATIDLE